MTVAYDQNASPIVNQPFLYVNGLVASNDATTPNTVLDLSAGICRDSTNTFDIILGNYLGMTSSTATQNVSTSINFATTGVNGLDTGTLGSQKVYYIYVITDPTNTYVPAAIASLAVPSIGPLMPYGYGAFRHVAYAVSDSSDHLLKFYQIGNNNARKFVYDAPQATSITDGNSTIYTAIPLLNWVPNLNINQNVQVQFAYTPATAGNALSLQALNGTGAQQTLKGQVASVVLEDIVNVVAQQTSSGTIQPEINYKVGNDSDSVAINVAGFEFYI